MIVYWLSSVLILYFWYWLEFLAWMWEVLVRVTSTCSGFGACFSVVTYEGELCIVTFILMCSGLVILLYHTVQCFPKTKSNGGGGQVKKILLHL